MTVSHDKRSFSVAFLETFLSFLKKPTFSTVNCLVRVALFQTPLTLVRLGLVYSPTRSRKKKAMVMRSPIVCACAVEFGWCVSANTFLTTAIGTASCGIGNGSSRLIPSTHLWMGRL